MDAQLDAGTALHWVLEDYFWSADLLVRSCGGAAGRAGAWPLSARVARARQAAAPRGGTPAEEDSFRLAFEDFWAQGAVPKLSAAAPGPARDSAWAPLSPSRCQIPGCGASLEGLRAYNKRAKCVVRRRTPHARPPLAACLRELHSRHRRARRLCGAHLRAEECPLPDGGRGRFCQVRAGADTGYARGAC